MTWLQYTPSASNTVDAAIGFSLSSAVGFGVWSTNGSGETLTTTVRPRHTKTCIVFMSYFGASRGSVTVSGDAGNSDFIDRYYEGASNVTRSVENGSFTWRDVKPRSKAKTLKVEVEPRATATSGENYTVLVTTTSESNPTATDTVAYSVTAE